MTLVETIPLLDLDEIQLTPGAVNTWEAQVALANGAKKTLDVTFMYENLLAESDAPHASSFSRDLGARRIMHMKLWVADGASAYVGSANLDWASLAQVKEFGVLVEDGAVGGISARSSGPGPWRR
ncbi:N-acylphosphatidylethanolamine-specific phospholipase D [Aureococcus anophagefferens]|nr:N-acylphosphatidylethanolamine-specific phospholipase D [Aureococcus anophagefferens]